MELSVREFQKQIAEALQRWGAANALSSRATARRLLNYARRRQARRTQPKPRYRHFALALIWHGRVQR